MSGFDDASVFQVEADVGATAHLFVVSHHQDSTALLVQVGEQIQDDVLVGGVQVAGGLVGQDDLGVVHQRARDGHALLLAAGKLGGQMTRAIGKAHAIERAAGFAFVGHAVEVLR